MKTITFALQNCGGNEDHFCILMDQAYSHYCNISHVYCIHADDYIPKGWKFVTESNAREALQRQFQVAKDNACKYYQNCVIILIIFSKTCSNLYF